MHTSLYELQMWPIFYVCPAVKVQFSKQSLSTKCSTTFVPITQLWPAVAGLSLSASMLLAENLWACWALYTQDTINGLILQAVLAGSACAAGPLGSPWGLLLISNTFKKLKVDIYNQSSLLLSRHSIKLYKCKCQINACSKYNFLIF